MKIDVQGFDKAKAFYALANSDGTLVVNNFGEPVVRCAKRMLAPWRSSRAQKLVRIYYVAEERA